MTPGLHFVTREGASESWSRYRGWRLLLHCLAHLAIKAIVTAAEHNSYVCFVLFLFCFYISVRVCLQIQGALRECRSIRSAVRRPPYHCVPLGTDFARGHERRFQFYQKWSKFNWNYKDRRTSIFWLMVLSTKIDSVCVQMFWADLGTNADGCRWHDWDAGVSNIEQSWYQESFLILFFTIRPHLDHANNQKLKYGWYKGSNLEGLKISDFSWFGPIQRQTRFWGAQQAEEERRPTIYRTPHAGSGY